MKKFTFLLSTILMSLAMLAQVPDSPTSGPMGINYQTVIRDGDGNILPDTELSLQMTIRSGAPDGAVVYSETHDVSTNAFGLVNLVIGYGVPLSNAFAEIIWGDGEKYLETAVDVDGSGTYTVLGVTQFLSVPYAFHAQTTETFAETDPQFNDWDKSTGIAITENQITNLQDYLTEEVDPEFNAWDKSTGISITENQITDLQDYLTEEVDPEFNAWDKSTGIAITENQISDLQDYLTEELDGDPTNEFQNLGSTKDGNQVSLTITNGTGTTIDVTDTDADPANELQTVTEQDYEVTLSQGGGSFMTGVKSYTQAEIDAMIPYNGLTVHNSTTNCINYYYLDNWFEACGTCTPQPTEAIAGDDQTFYDETLTATLAANTPEQGIGLWTVESGEGGSFDDASLPEATFTGDPCTDYTLLWSISNSCGTSSDDVQINFFATPTVAFAGNDTIVEGIAASIGISANTPEIGEGIWSVLSGEGGSFDDATKPDAVFSGLFDVPYTLQWTISTTCDASYDEVAISFTIWECGSPMTDFRDGQTYQTVLIGEQCWMAENINIGSRINGGEYQTDDGTIEKYCYNDSVAKCDEYGGLYQWDEMMAYANNEGAQGICPVGWHLPTDTEWSDFTTFVSSQPEYICNSNTDYIVKALAANTNWGSSTEICAPGNNQSANNATGFSGLPGGSIGSNGMFTSLGYGGTWWSSTEHSAPYSFVRFIAHYVPNVNRSLYTKNTSVSVRCLLD